MCFCAGPAVSLNNPTCLGPTGIQSLSGNLQYGGKIKRRHGSDWWGGGDEKVDRAHRGRRAPLIHPPPLSRGERACAGCWDPGNRYRIGSAPPRVAYSRNQSGAYVPSDLAPIIYSANRLLRFHYIAENLMRNIAEHKLRRPRSDGTKQLFAGS